MSMQPLQWLRRECCCGARGDSVVGRHGPPNRPSTPRNEGKGSDCRQEANGQQRGADASGKQAPTEEVCLSFESVIFLLIRAFAGVLWFLCHTWPRLFLRFVPRGSSALSLANFYFYAQALGLLWVFCVSLTAAIAMNVLQVVVGGGEGGGAAAAASVGRSPMRALVIVYVYHCLCRILVLGSSTMWLVLWETYYDFPTMRFMMLGRRRSHASSDLKPPVDAPVASSSMEETPPKLTRQISPGREGEGKVHITRRIISLCVPLVVLNLLNLAILIGQGLCEGHLEDHCQGLEFFNPTARINRTLRFVLFVAMLQWLQAWTGFFPHWHWALRQSKHWLATTAQWILVFGLLPASVLRLVVWLFRPAGTGVSQSLLFGFRHFFVDALLVSGWSLWLLFASALILRGGLLHVSGFSTRSISHDETWQNLASSFKFTLAVWILIAWVRGVAKLGFAHGQSDCIFISILYPWLLALIWTITFILVALARHGHRLRVVSSATVVVISVCIVVARLLCGIADRLHHPLLVAVVSLYLGRQVFRVARSWLRFFNVQEEALSSSPPGSPARGGQLGANGDKPPSGKAKMRRALRDTVDFSVHTLDMLESSKSERRLATAAVQVLLLVCFSFIMVLSGCVLLSGLQQRVGLFIEDVMYWRNVTGGVEIVNSEVSRMVMGMQSSNATAELDPTVAALPHGTKPRYAVCGHEWFGLSLLDYSMLSSVSYMSNTPRNDLPGLFRMLMPHRQVTVNSISSSSRRWLDLEVAQCDKVAQDGKVHCKSVTVISISGTDPTRFSDYAENIRMWTEPVSLQILSALFPSVRTWPRDTTGEVIALMHTTLEWLAIQDDQWHYQEILNHVQKKPLHEDVVITGHSLGGGMALVVGALTGRLAVALQPPGVYHSLAKHQLQFERIRKFGDTAVHQRSVTLKFEGDWVQHFDEHGGLVQTMSCDRSHQGVQLACHMLEGAICHLLRHCGDQEQRFSSCRHEYAMTSAAETILRSLWTSAQRHWRSAGWKALDAYANVGPAVRTALCVSLVAAVRQAPFLQLLRRFMSWALSPRSSG